MLIAFACACPEAVLSNIIEHHPCLRCTRVVDGRSDGSQALIGVHAEVHLRVAVQPVLTRAGFTDGCQFVLHQRWICCHAAHSLLAQQMLNYACRQGRVARFHDQGTGVFAVEEGMPRSQELWFGPTTCGSQGVTPRAEMAHSLGLSFLPVGNMTLTRSGHVRFREMLRFFIGANTSSITSARGN